jgi:hypothetical protein
MTTQSNNKQIHLKTLFNIMKVIFGNKSKAIMEQLKIPQNIITEIYISINPELNQV